jgi:prepilin-type N-terminal cleavage/methylation domain-containing protein
MASFWILGFGFRISGQRPEVASRKFRRGFTLVEMLVVMVVIAMLVAITVRALAQAREAARAAKTKATIAKIHELLVRKYESYLSRRVPLNLPVAVGRLPNGPKVVARARLDAIRDLMRLEMPDRWTDIIDEPVALPQRPSISRLYKQKYDANPPDTTADPSNGRPGYGPAECLYLTLMTGNAEAREMFKQDEIADVDGDGWPEFVDGWGNPIMWLRWAPGFTPYSDIQVDDTQSVDLHHDPFDPMKLEKDAYDLKPLVYSSAGSKTDYGIKTDGDYRYSTGKRPYATMAGQPETDRALIHNHHIE